MNYKIIYAYSREQFEQTLASYAGCTFYTSVITGATEVYSGRTCLAVVHKEY